MDNLNFNKQTKHGRLNIQVEESTHTLLTSTESKNKLVMLDHILMPNGEMFVVTKIHEDGSVELMKKGRITIAKENLPEFLRGSLIDRADCFK